MRPFYTIAFRKPYAKEVNFYCAEKSYSSIRSLRFPAANNDEPIFNGMWVVTDEYCQLIAPGRYEVMPF